MNALIARQQADGCWEGEMVWSTVILSQVVITRHIVGFPFSTEDGAHALRYYGSTRTIDGVWAMHPEGTGSVFATALAYVAQRLLGASPDEPTLIQARDWLHRQPGGVAAAPSWCKFWLAILGLYGWEGMNPVPPELFLLPRWLPFHPDRLYCHTRAIYLGMANLYGRRFCADLGPLRDELNRELYGDVAPDFRKYRHDISPTDLIHRPAWILRRAWDLLTIYERRPIRRLRRRALVHCSREIDYGQRTTRYQGISPINALLNMIGQFESRPDHPELPAGVAGIEHWRWRNDAGIRYVGARSQPWDTAFALQALLVDPISTSDAIARGYSFLDDCQIVDELADGREHGRSITRGGWCFTEGTHRWPVSDCTAEALEVILAIHRAGIHLSERISDERLMWAAEFILSRQNPEGGFGSYEERRGHPWLQMLNPSELFARCMIEESYVECTGSSVSALCHFREEYPDSLQRADRAIEKGVRFLRKMQRPDGAWPAAWGIHHTYAAFFAVRGLRAAGVPATDPCLVRAADWLLKHQRDDGAWGEHHSSALTGEWVAHPDGQPAMTAWAVLTLAEILGSAALAVLRGVEWLKGSQIADGVWPDGAVNGVFFGTSMLHYELYPQYFPAWALAKVGGTRDNSPTALGPRSSGDRASIS